MAIRWKPWQIGAAIAVFSLVALLNFESDSEIVLPSGQPLSTNGALASALATTAFFALMLWLPFRLTRAHTLQRGEWTGPLAVHAAAGTALGLLEALRRIVLEGMLGIPGREDLFSHVSAMVLMYLLLAGAAHARVYARRHRDRELAALRLEAELRQAELECTRNDLRVLKMELNPHFLFNSLHAVSSLMHESGETARRMIQHLGELLRSCQQSVDVHEVTLREEIRLLQPFLEIEKIRFGGRLRVEWEVPEGAMDARVPHMVLQPLLENAIKHGLAPRDGEGCITVSAEVEPEGLRLRVRDDGVGLRDAPGSTQGTGIGLSNIRSRVRQLYATDGEVRLQNAPGGGTVAEVSLRRGAGEPAGADVSDPEPRALDAVFRTLRRASYAVFFVLVWVSFLSTADDIPVAPGAPFPWPTVLALTTLGALFWTALMALTFRLSNRYPVGPGHWLGRSLLHLGAGVSMGTLNTLCKLGGRRLLELPSPGPLPQYALEVIAVTMPLYLLLAGVAHALVYARRNRDRELAEARLEVELGRVELERARSELRVLKMELNPRFLFGALESISALIPVDPATAHRMLIHLGRLLRRDLEERGRQEVSLEEELEALEPYLEIERTRLQGLRVEWEVDEEALDERVPHRILQPLVENAIRHGLTPRGGAGFIQITARMSDGTLHIELRDDGVGIPAAPEGEEPGAGLPRTRERLRRLYRDDAALQLRSAPGEGTSVLLVIPAGERRDRLDAASFGGFGPLPVRA